MKTLIDGFYRLLQVLLTLLMAALIVPVTLQIVSRFTGLVPRYVWTEELARFAFIWVIMIGSMIAVRDGSHFDLEILPTARTPRGRAALRMVRHVAMLLVALIFVWFGYRFAQFGLDQESDLTGINMLAIHIAWPLAGVAYLIFLGEKLVTDVRIFRRNADE